MDKPHLLAAYLLLVAAITISMAALALPWDGGESNSTRSMWNRMEGPEQHGARETAYYFSSEPPLADLGWRRAVAGLAGGAFAVLFVLAPWAVLDLAGVTRGNLMGPLLGVVAASTAGLAAVVAMFLGLGGPGPFLSLFTGAAAVAAAVQWNRGQRAKDAAMPGLPETGTA